MPQMWNNPGKWTVNPMNFFPEVWEGAEPPERVFILDSTVRKITGTPGAHYDPERIGELCTIADEIGVEWIEVNLVHGNMPSSPKLRKMIRRIKDKTRRVKVVGTSWGDRETIDDAIDNGADAVCIGGSSGAADKKHEEYLESCQYIRSRGAEVAAHLKGRIENLTTLQAARMLDATAEGGAIYCGIHENTGATSPDAWRYFMKSVRKQMTHQDMPIVPHIHNVFGQAVAGAVQAVMGGARGIDCTIGGIAIHAGLVAMEDFVAIMEMQYGIHTGVRMDLLRTYYEALQAFGGFDVAPNKSIVGRQAFIKESDSFVTQILTRRGTPQPWVHGFNPSVVGGEFYPVFGENTVHGMAIRTKLEQLGLPAGEEAVRLVAAELQRVVDAKTAYPCYLTEDEMDELCRQTVTEAPSV